MKGLQHRLLGHAGLLVMAMLTEAMEAMPDGGGEYELLWIDKSPNFLPLAKRKAVCAQTSWSLCPASVGGGCCPDNFDCGTSSCYATTAGPTSCNGQFNFYSCPLTAGPGTCCPVGLICGKGGNCDAPPGSSISITCPASFFNCPASLGGACCADGRICGPSVCYENTPMTLPVSETKTTTDSDGHTTVTVVTSTTIFTDLPSISTSALGAGVPQLIPSTVAKIAAIQTGDSGGGGGGLSGGAVGGIVAGVVVILLIVLAIALFIFLRLRKADRAAKAAEAAEYKRDYKRESPNSHGQSHRSASGQQSISEIDSTTDINPLGVFPIMRPSSRIPSASTGNNIWPSHTPDFSNASSSPPVWGTPFSYARSDTSDGRQSSAGSYSYHDSHAPQRVSVDSRGSPGHSRRTSGTSELDGQHGISELGGLNNNEAGSSRQGNSAQRPAKTHVRKNSDLSGHTRGRSDTGALGTVDEMYELHGHFGPAHDNVGKSAMDSNRGP
ncbi:hypothetical protein F4861DRAFT_536582 [Xylaria intraflava]|nr:hypothetical protein F4861DRAFT_536582 [Xylaria intraflava]